MLLDEAFSALDPIIRTDMQSLLVELQDELHKTIVFITHDLDEALRLADHLVILQDGKIAQQGEPQQIVLNPADDYIDNFVRDINRARVLRAASVMKEGQDQAGLDGEVNASDTLESVIAKADGRIDRSFTVVSDGAIVGWIDMHVILRALVPTQIDQPPWNAALRQ
jgi:glycine betaine/proline transport system ATP-binding protein